MENGRFDCEIFDRLVKVLTECRDAKNYVRI